MISDRALAALRCSAAVLHCTSGVRLRLSHDGATVLDVSRQPFEDTEHPVVPTCRFRAAVARAHAENRNGHPVAMCGLPDGVDPQISYGVRHDDRVLPGGVVRLERDGAWLHVTAFAHHPSLGDTLAAATDVDNDAPEPAFDVEVLVDDVLDVSVVCILTPAGDTFGSARALDQLGDLAGRVAIAEIEQHLAAVAAR